MMFFKNAKPVWLGYIHEINSGVGFRGDLEADRFSVAAINIAASCIYRLTINGRFVCHGPAVAPHGVFRVDTVDITEALKYGQMFGECDTPVKAAICIEVLGYNANGFYTLNQSSFLQAEVTLDGKPVLSTGRDFGAVALTHRVRKVPRYSYQRAFTEVYNLDGSCEQWKQFGTPLLEPQILPDKKLLTRNVPLPDFGVNYPVRHLSRGCLIHLGKLSRYENYRFIRKIGENTTGFPVDELTENPFYDLQEYLVKTLEYDEYECSEGVGEDNDCIAFAENDLHIYELENNLTGFLGARLRCDGDAKVVFVFDELLTNGDVDYKRHQWCNAVTLNLKKGCYDFESMEMYTMKYIKVMCLCGSVRVNGLYLRNYCGLPVKASCSCGDKRYETIFNAAVQTFLQNAVDTFLDCPSRERGAWLCDSFFMGRSAFYLTGNTLIEDNFLQNYLLPERFENIPDGMVPMCYPADFPTGEYIPNWGMWLVLQLREYKQRAGHTEIGTGIIEGFCKKVADMLIFFETYENSEGLLQKLDGWIFIDFSAANDFVNDISFPTNMLYVGMLRAAAELYDLPQLHDKAARVKQAVLKYSWNGSFFADNALVSDGRIITQTNITETCQYYAFFFDIATPATHPQLWEALVRQFGTARSKHNPYPNVYYAATFIGNFLRLELLSRYGETKTICDDILTMFYHMAKTTGSLWEDADGKKSCNHGFGSYAAVFILRDIVGVAGIAGDARA